MLESIYITLLIITIVIFGLGLNNLLYKKDGTALFFFFVAFALCSWLSVASFNITENFDVVTNSTMINGTTETTVYHNNAILEKVNYDVGAAYFFGAFAGLCLMFGIGDVFQNWRKKGM